MDRRRAILDGSELSEALSRRSDIDARYLLSSLARRAPTLTAGIFRADRLRSGRRGSNSGRLFTCVPR
jgi:hypothetical protein